MNEIFIVVIGIIIGGLITLIVAFYFFSKSASKKDVQELKRISKDSEESTQKVIKNGVEEIKNEDKLTYTIYLENLVNSQFNRFLEYHKLDKNLLIKELEGEKIETLYIIKQKETDDQKLLKERIKILGFKHVTFGDWILPPKKLKDKGILKQQDGVKRWVEKNLIKGMDLKDFVNSVAIINLSNMYDEERGKTKRARKIIGGILKPTDFISKEKLISDIHKNNNISLREILQIPFLDSLIDQEHTQILGYIKNLNTKLIEKIEKKLEIEHLKTTDLINLKESELEDIMNSFNIKNSRMLSKEILRNVKIMDSYLNKENNFKGDLKC